MKNITMTNIIKGRPIIIEGKFSADSFNENEFNGLIDPLVMVDHFSMKKSTFPAHPHAGIYAITYMFEDSTTSQMNYDNLGNIYPITPGSIHLFLAGSGGIHTEQPEKPGANVHALQIFLNLAGKRKYADPAVFALNAENIPEYHEEGVRLRVIVGESNGVLSPLDIPDQFGLIDCFLLKGKTVTHQVPAGWNIMAISIKGQVQLVTEKGIRVLNQGEAVGIGRTDSEEKHTFDVSLTAQEDAQIVLLSGYALYEPLYRQGPFVMNSRQRLEDRVRAYQDGELGFLDITDENKVSYVKPKILIRNEST